MEEVEVLVVARSGEEMGWLPEKEGVLRWRWWDWEVSRVVWNLRRYGRDSDFLVIEEDDDDDGEDDDDDDDDEVGGIIGITNIVILNSNVVAWRNWRVTENEEEKTSEVKLGIRRERDNKTVAAYLTFLQTSILSDATQLHVFLLLHCASVLHKSM